MILYTYNGIKKLKILIWFALFCDFRVIRKSDTSIGAGLSGMMLGYLFEGVLYK